MTCRAGLDQAWQEKFIEYKVGRAAANTGLFGALDPDEPRLAPCVPSVSLHISTGWLAVMLL